MRSRTESPSFEVSLPYAPEPVPERRSDRASGRAEATRRERADAGRSPSRAAIDRIAEDGPTRFRAVDAQLMSASRHRLQLKPSESFGPAQDTPMGQAGVARWVGLHPPRAWIGGAAGQGQVDAAPIIGRAIGDDSPVGLVHGIAGKQLAKTGQCLGMAAESETSRRVAVEAVRRLRPPGQAEAEGVEMVGQRLAAARPRMDRKARWLVDDEHQGIAIEQARAYVGCMRHRIRDMRRIRAECEGL